MPLATKEVLQLSGVCRKTLTNWKRRYGVANRRVGWWTVRELAALERGAAVKLGAHSQNPKAKGGK